MMRCSQVHIISFLASAGGLFLGCYKLAELLEGHFSGYVTVWYVRQYELTCHSRIFEQLLLATWHLSTLNHKKTTGHSRTLGMQQVCGYAAVVSKPDGLVTTCLLVVNFPKWQKWRFVISFDLWSHREECSEGRRPHNFEGIKKKGIQVLIWKEYNSVKWSDHVSSFEVEA